MGAPDQREQDQGRSGAQEHGLGRIAFERPGQRRRGGDDHGEPADLEEAEQDEVRQDLVPRGLVDQAVDLRKVGP